MGSHILSPIFSFSPRTVIALLNPNKLQTTTTDTTFFRSQNSIKKNSAGLKTTYCCTFINRPLYIPDKISNDTYVRVLDTTLRDGEQAPGATMAPKEKLTIAYQLAKLGVDVIEAGFPISSKAEFETTRMIAKEVGNFVDEFGHVPAITAVARLVRADIDLAWEAVKHAKKPRVTTFISTSEIHMKYKLKKSKEEVLRSVKEMVRYTRSLGITDIEFASEDSARSDKVFLYKVFEEAIEAGATTITFTDTVGCMLPDEWGNFIMDMKANISGVENVIIATHCHNDLGLATANTLAAVNAGARQVEVTMNGIGERAGNAALEEIVMAIKCRGKDQLAGLYTGINTKHIVMTSKMVEEYSGLPVQPNKAIIGANAFSHGSGIHQDGMLKNGATYEFISAEDVGFSRSNNNGIVLGKLSGRHAMKYRLLELGYEVDEKKIDGIFKRFKAVAEKKKIVSDNDLILLVCDDETFQPEVSTWKLVGTEVISSINNQSKATVKLINTFGQEHVATAVGTSSINSAFKAIDLIVKVPVTIVEYDMKLAAEGLDGVASVRVVLRGEKNTTSGPQIVSGSGAGMDMIMATGRAYMNALNKLLGLKKQTISEVV